MTKRTNNLHKITDLKTRTSLKNGGELGCSERVISSCSTCGTGRVILVTHPVISHEWIIGPDCDYDKRGHL